MKDKTIDYILRVTWQAVARMYNEEASKFDGSMAIGFALLSIEKEDGTPKIDSPSEDKIAPVVESKKIPSTLVKSTI